MNRLNFANFSDVNENIVFQSQNLNFTQVYIMILNGFPSRNSLQKYS